ncbi:hypothetical protein IN18_20690 [Salmonella enterica]|uniref:hypothetical protein n=1 Tax=Salmonella enterica TaxID=28901 RepID=UPI00073590A9|nr:hypothetical protein [Salmonella enterica]KTL97094.1 hypothetical protein IN18_20690 [Salmonella enterica]
MKKIYTAAFLLIFTPLTYATGFPCAGCGIVDNMIKGNADETPIMVMLDTPIEKNDITPKEINLISHDDKCLYSGVLTQTLSKNKDSRIIDVNKKVCGSNTEKVSYSVLSISSSEQYSKGTPLKLYHVAVMTSAGPLFSADVMSEMIKDIADAVEQAKSKGLTK